jgi:hypothetical protein
MKPPVLVIKTLALIAAAVAVFGVFFAVESPWFVRWGTTDAEMVRALPGDDLVSDARAQSTRAVTIAAPMDAGGGFARSRSAWPRPCSSSS